MNKILTFIVFLLITSLAGVIGKYIGGDFITYYLDLNKPFFSPEPFVFGIVWSILYLLIALSAFIYFMEAKKDYKKGLTLFGVNLILNALWSYFFFGMRNPMLGLIEIIISIGVTAINIYLFNKKSKKAALLMLPYFLWIIFAAILNYAVIVLN
ncbi:MAG: tryptophan-rich sensory protein [Candidatus Pacebacteria bacterium]|nr:tryptophan-rich sensory protein [Candidatus Paceibacterota bacterium]